MSLTVVELRALAKKEGIKGYSKMKKADLIILLGPDNDEEIDFPKVDKKALEKEWENLGRNLEKDVKKAEKKAITAANKIEKEWLLKLSKIEKAIEKMREEEKAPADIKVAQEAYNKMEKDAIKATNAAHKSVKMVVAAHRKALIAQTNQRHVELCKYLGKDC